MEPLETPHFFFFFLLHIKRTLRGLRYDFGKLLSARDGSKLYPETAPLTAYCRSLFRGIVQWKKSAVIMVHLNHGPHKGVIFLGYNMSVVERRKE